MSEIQKPTIQMKLVAIVDDPYDDAEFTEAELKERRKKIIHFYDEMNKLMDRQEGKFGMSTISHPDLDKIIGKQKK